MCIGWFAIKNSVKTISTVASAMLAVAIAAITVTSATFKVASANFAATSAMNVFAKSAKQ